MLSGNNQKMAYDDGKDFCKEVLLKLTLMRKTYTSIDTDPENSNHSYYGYFETQNEEIVGVGEERMRDGGWVWLKGMKELNSETLQSIIGDWPNLYDLALGILQKQSSKNPQHV